VLHDNRKNLINTWKKLVCETGDITDALSTMNRKLGTHYQHGRLGVWSRGNKLPAASTINYMLTMVLPRLLSDAGMKDKKTIKQIVDSVQIPDKDRDTKHKEE
jgi:hypothetical protein